MTFIAPRRVSIRTIPTRAGSPRRRRSGRCRRHSASAFPTRRRGCSMATACRRSPSPRRCGRLRRSAARSSPIDFTPFFQIAELLYQGTWIAERYTVVEHLLRDRPETLHPVTRQVIEAAERYSAADAFRGLYRLRELQRRIAPALEHDRPALRSLHSDLLQGGGCRGRSDRTECPSRHLHQLRELHGSLRHHRAGRHRARDGRPGSVTLLAAGGTRCAHRRRSPARCSAGAARRWARRAGRCPAPAAANPAPRVG